MTYSNIFLIWLVTMVIILVFFYCAKKLNRRIEMTPLELEKITQKAILKARIRNLQRWGGGNTTTTRIKELKEELIKLEVGEDGLNKTNT